MSDYVNFRSRRFLPKIKLVVLVSVVLSFFLIFNLTKETINRRQINEKIRSLEGEVKSLESENFILADTLTEWQSGNRLEKEARLKLGLKKEGEKVIIINREADENGFFAPTVLSASEEKEISNFQKWRSYFFNR